MSRQSFPQSTSDDPRWQRIVARDRTADGEFWYSVSSTRVYCRPSCPSRRASPTKVNIHESLAEARATGFRPCRRCRPEGASIAETNAAVVSLACRLIEQSDQALSLTQLSEATGCSVSHLHRLFKSMTGVTPKEYAVARRAEKLRHALIPGARVTDAIYEAGFGSSGRFYEQATPLLGMKPQQYREGGVDEQIHFAVGATSLGAILVASSAKGVVSILLGDDPELLIRDLQDRFPKARLVGADHGYESLVARVVAFVESPRLGLDLPLDIRGTAFQMRVWRELQKIPFGGTVSYEELARRVGVQSSVVAVAGACASNPLALAIPCHRVVKSDASLWGYAWGIERKETLLRKERR